MRYFPLNAECGCLLRLADRSSSGLTGIGYNKIRPMGSGSEYIKEIESYFLTLAGEGIMLSPIDYSLIQDWKKRQVPKEVVLKGINRAFSETGTKSKGAGLPPRSLKHCVSYVEKCIEEYGPQVTERKSKRESRPGGADMEVLGEARTVHTRCREPGPQGLLYKAPEVGPRPRQGGRR